MLDDKIFYLKRTIQWRKFQFGNHTKRFGIIGLNDGVAGLFVRSSGVEDDIKVKVHITYNVVAGQERINETNVRIA